MYSLSSTLYYQQQIYLAVHLWIHYLSPCHEFGRLCPFPLHFHTTHLIMLFAASSPSYLHSILLLYLRLQHAKQNWILLKYYITAQRLGEIDLLYSWTPDGTTLACFFWEQFLSHLQYDMLYLFAPIGALALKLLKYFLFACDDTSSMFFSSKLQAL